MSRQITITNWKIHELEMRIKDCEKRGYVLKSRGHYAMHGFNYRQKYWAVLVEKEESSE